MRNTVRILVAVLCLAGFGVSNAAAQSDSDTMTVNFQVDVISVIDISGSSVSLTINSVNSVGGGVANATDSSTYAITNNDTGKKITGALDSAMPSNVTLTLSLGAPTGAVSEGTKTLSDSATDLVTSIEGVNQTGLAMSFTLSATVAAGVQDAATRTLTLTLVDEA
jgi:hypothetical protein